MGSVVGDALGVPYEFTTREMRSKQPARSMVGYGTHMQPEGTWSDDTSMLLGTLKSLQDEGKANYEGIMREYIKWYDNCEYTPHGKIFDIGGTTVTALFKYDPRKKNALQCGGISERSNGNGSLMRILPLAFYIDFSDLDTAFETIHNVSRLTHAHIKSQIACGIYISIAERLIKGDTKEEAVRNGVERAKNYYLEQGENYIHNLFEFDRITSSDITEIDEDDIKSGGYVIDTLTVALWTLLTTNNYKDCVLKAINLGGDTDTNGAVAGGLAGLYYGIKDIPVEWVNKIVKRDYIMNMIK